MGNQVIDTAYGPIAAHFRKAKLSDLCYERIGIQTGPFGSQLHQKDYVAIGTPIITVEHLGENRIIHQDLPRVSEEDRKRLGRYALEVGDIVFSRVGAVDRRSLVREEEDGWLFSGRCLRVRPNAALIDSVFLSWFFGLPSFKDYIRRIAVGATMPSLNTEILSNVPIYYPSLPEQRAIAHILGTLDDKIELNRKMNETLEAMAQAIFKSWFVDFEPFRGQGMEDSPLGPIPKGWRIGILGDIADNQHRGIHPKDVDPSTPYIGLEHMPRKCIGLSEWGHAKELESNKFRFKKGEFLFGKLRPYFHKVGVAPLDGVCSTDILVIAPKEPACFGFALGHISSTEFVAYTDAGSTGTKMPRTNWQDMARYKIVIPPQPLAESFNEVICPLVDKIIRNIHQSHTLASIRDTLLPKLLSGEIRVKDAERFAEQAA